MNDPLSGERIRTLNQFNTAVQAMTPALPEGQLQMIPETTQPTAPPRQETAMDIVERGRVAAAEREAAALTGAETELAKPEDAQASLGGGQNTYDQLGFLPAGTEKQITSTIARGRGGQLVTRFVLSGRFRDVPVEEGSRGPNTFNIEQAKEELLRGGGTPLSRLRLKNKKPSAKSA